MGGFAGYILSIKSKPAFNYMGITGNRIKMKMKIVLNQNKPLELDSIQCAVRYEVKYWLIGERFIARNSRGWLAIIRGDGTRLHNAPAPWALDGKCSVDVVGEEGLVLFDLVENVSGYFVFIPGVQPRDCNLPFKCLKYGNPIGIPSIPESLCKDVLSYDDDVEVRVAAENAHGAIMRWKASEVIRKCLESHRMKGVPVK